jgi:hypothetical protein
VAQVGFQAADHHGVKLARPDRNTAGEALRVENFEQAGERVEVAIGRRGRQEQPVLEASGEVAQSW